MNLDRKGNKNKLESIPHVSFQIKSSGFEVIQGKFTFRRAVQSELVHMELGESNFFNDRYKSKKY